MLKTPECFKRFVEGRGFGCDIDKPEGMSYDVYIQLKICFAWDKHFNLSIDYFQGHMHTYAESI